MPMRQKNPAALKERTCYLCTNALNDVDYKDVRFVQRFVSSSSKIMPRRRSGTCVKHQRVVAQAIKRARFMALIPYTVR